MRQSIVFSFTRKALDHINLVSLIVRRKGREFMELYPNCKNVKVQFFEYDSENPINNKITLRIEGTC